MSENNEFSFENPQYRKTYWHTCSHVMAQAVKRLGQLFPVPLLRHPKHGVQTAVPPVGNRERAPVYVQKHVGRL